MELITYKNSNQDVRVDKNVAFNITNFRVYKEDAKILKAIILYMAINHQQRDLFGFYKLDPKDFAKVMFLSERKLFSLHSSPYFKAHDPNAEALIRKEAETPNGRMSMHRTWSSVLENALYILTNKSLIDDYRTRLNEDIIITQKRINFIDEITFKLITTGKTKKVVYYYKPNSHFEENLKSYFLNTKIAKYNALKKPKLDEAYLDLLNRINNAEAKNLFTITFNADTLGKLLQIKKYARFSSYKAKITEKFEVLKNVIGEDVKGLSLTWMKPLQDVTGVIDDIEKKSKTSHHKNLAIINWSRPSKEQISERNSKTFENLFYTELTRELIKTYFNTYEGKINVYNEESKKTAFYDWFFSEKDLDIKIIPFESTHLYVYKSTQWMKDKLNIYKKTIIFLTKVKNKHKALVYEEGKLKLFVPSEQKVISFDHLYELLKYTEVNFSNYVK